MNISYQPIAMSYQIHTYTELRKQIHDGPAHPTSRMGRAKWRILDVPQETTR
jgi:hypothetical protein